MTSHKNVIELTCITA